MYWFLMLQKPPVFFLLSSLYLLYVPYMKWDYYENNLRNKLISLKLKRGLKRKSRDSDMVIKKLKNAFWVFWHSFDYFNIFFLLIKASPTYFLNRKKYVYAIMTSFGVKIWLREYLVSGPFMLLFANAHYESYRLIKVSLKILFNCIKICVYSIMTSFGGKLGVI